MLTYFGVHLGPSIPEELPSVADLPDHIQIKVRDDNFILIFTALNKNLSLWIDKIAGTVKLTEFPRFFKAYTIVGADKYTIGHCLGRLFQFP